MDCLTPASSSEPHCFYSRSLDFYSRSFCFVSYSWTVFTTSAFEAFEIQVAVKHIISKGDLRKRVDGMSEHFAEEKLCATLQHLLVLA